MIEGRDPGRASRPSHLTGALIRRLCEPCAELRHHTFKLGGETLLECTVCGNVRGIKPSPANKASA